MNRIFNPSTIAPPRGVYSHCCGVPAGARFLYVAGQGGVAPDGTIPKDIEAQCELALRNVRCAVESGGMTVQDVVKLTVLLLERDSLEPWRNALRKEFGELRPPNTVQIVIGLANPEWKVEIDAVAAKAD